MKKFIFIMLLVFSVCIFFVSCSENTDKNSDENLDKKNLTYEYFNEKVNTNEYFWMISFGDEVLTIATKNGKNYNKLQKTDGDEVQIYKDGVFYRVLEGDELYMIEEKEEDDLFRVETLKSTGINKENYSVGTKDIFGTEYYYEEFEAENSRDRYYFDGEQLVYIEFIPSSGESRLIKILESENTVSDELFEIPEHYKLKAY